MFINSILLNICMGNSFIEELSIDWEPSFKSRQKNSWNWFFFDSDKDGVMNGVDCKPYNKKKQDGFPAIQSSATSYFKVPYSTPIVPSKCGPPCQKTITPIVSLKPVCSYSSVPIKSGPDQNISMAPKPIKQNIPVSPAPQINYTDTNKKYIITSGGGITDENGAKVNPIYRPYNPITKTGGGLTDYYRGDLNPAAGDAIKKGYNVKAIENMYDTHPLYPDQNAKSLAVTAAKTYLQNNNVNVTDVNGSSSIKGQAAVYTGRNIKMYKESQPDYNGLFIHETVHAIQKGHPLDPTQASKIYNSSENLNAATTKTPNITGNNIHGNYIKRYITEPIYKNINTNSKQMESEAYYIQQYYDKKQPRNTLVDTFEKRLDINTTRKLTPEQQTIYKSSSETLIKQANDKNDMITGIFSPMKSKKGIFEMTL